MQAPLRVLLALGLGCSLPALAEVETYRIDAEHSFANWQVRHIVALTSGTFHDIKGKVNLDTANLARSTVEASISLYSLNSSHRRRDIHLLTDEYLDARDYPEMTFVSTSVQPSSTENGMLNGNLTLRGVTRPVSMNYRILGVGLDPWGGKRIGLQATTRIKRADFGVGKVAPGGPVGDEVDITLLIEGIKLGADGQPWNARKAQEEAAKVISYPATTPPPAVVQPAPAKPVAPAASEPAKAETTEDQLKRKLRDIFR
jgi:polyisoprenoid-binding protein YceI